MPTSDYPGFDWLARHWDDLRSYNFEWVAVTANGPVAHNLELTQVIEAVIRQRVQDRAVYAFIDFPEIENGIRDRRL